MNPLDPQMISNVAPCSPAVVPAYQQEGIREEVVARRPELPQWLEAARRPAVPEMWRSEPV